MKKMNFEEVSLFYTPVQTRCLLYWCNWHVTVVWTITNNGV